ncbi:DUF4147 domain-containing protein [Pseudodesulfovibrio cashew]|uniref:DUF4147 domain-containing protein n=1 Tax=Pseudodesulfovibrio cashew TaxID=2678688 RepID=A0A6I6JJ65_9BACT|nr:glycerate kinase [Pseudodesulfovibrio cashew]QGY40352.1 DUF4147 domain-containing protein [Pseudodesulfovibrio cashew]
MTTYLEKKTQLMRIVDRTIEAVAPDPAIRAAVSRKGDILTVDGCDYDLKQYERIFLLGAGKASAAMAETMEDLLGDDLHGGIVATKYGHDLPLTRTRVLESGHPVPDLAGERAARELLSLAKGATERDLVFCLLSGGASALVPAPCPPVTLRIKQDVTRRLLECGADIGEINAIRKHLSLFKGGRLAKALEPATVCSLIISDVVGDALDVIGSGPTAPDASTFLDCQATLDKYALCSKAPDEVTKVIAGGCSGDIPETLKADDPCFQKVRNVIVAGNGMAVAGAAEAAREMGYTPIVVDGAMQGEAREVAADLIRLAGEYCEGKHGIQPPVCLLAGGETTVTIKGKGLGGRNQELALAAVVELSGMQHCRERVAVMSLGTDGTDGPTDAAGALVLPDTVARSDEQSLAAREYLNDNNAYAFFDNAGTLLRTGPTRTNVMDVVAILVDPA